MRGLVQFIADLRNARARELEEKRINKELANIRYVCEPQCTIADVMLKFYVLQAKIQRFADPVAASPRSLADIVVQMAT